MILKQRAFFLAGASLLVLVGCEREKAPKTDVEKYSYAIGYQFAKNLKTQDVEYDAPSMKQAIADAAAGKESRIPEAEVQQVMQKMYEARQAKQNEAAGENLKKGTEWLEANKGKEGVKVTESGLQYTVVTEGKGASPKDDDVVTVHYTGTLIDGTEFDSSVKRGEPAKFPVKGVIPGWTEALKMMKKGAKWKRVIPPQLAYGERARPSIPANSVLIFDVELIDISKN